MRVLLLILVALGLASAASAQPVARATAPLVQAADSIVLTVATYSVDKERMAQLGVRSQISDSAGADVTRLTMTGGPCAGSPDLCAQIFRIVGSDQDRWMDTGAFLEVFSKLGMVHTVAAARATIAPGKASGYLVIRQGVVDTSGVQDPESFAPPWTGVSIEARSPAPYEYTVRIVRARQDVVGGVIGTRVRSASMANGVGHYLLGLLNPGDIGMIRLEQTGLP